MVCSILCSFRDSGSIKMKLNTSQNRLENVINRVKRSGREPNTNRSLLSKEPSLDVREPKALARVEVDSIPLSLQNVNFLQRKLGNEAIGRILQAQPSTSKKVHKALFIDSPIGGKCKKWRAKATTKHPKTTRQEIVNEFRTNFNALIKARPTLVTGTVSTKTSQADIDPKVAQVNKRIVKHFNSHIKSPLSDPEVQKRVQILPQQKTRDPDFVKQWLANRIYKLTSMADYCIDESDSRFQKVITDILADGAINKNVKIMANRQPAFFEGDGTSRNVYIHRGLAMAKVEPILVHELVHFYAHNDYRKWNDKMVAPRYINEGFTEFLAREAMGPTMLSGRNKYPDRFKFINDKVAKHVSVNNIAAAFFAGKVWQVEKVSKVAKALFKTSRRKKTADKVPTD